MGHNLGTLRSGQGFQVGRRLFPCVTSLNIVESMGLSGAFKAAVQGLEHAEVRKPFVFNLTWGGHKNEPWGDGGPVQGGNPC